MSGRIACVSKTREVTHIFKVSTKMETVALEIRYDLEFHGPYLQAASCRYGRIWGTVG